MLRKLGFLCILLALTSCSTTAASIGQIFDRLEFKEGQEGCIRATGQVAVGGNPFANSNINISLVKKQGENAEDC